MWGLRSTNARVIQGVYERGRKTAAFLVVVVS